MNVARDADVLSCLPTTSCVAFTLGLSLVDTAQLMPLSSSFRAMAVSAAMPGVGGWTY